MKIYFDDEPPLRRMLRTVKRNLNKDNLILLFWILALLAGIALCVIMLTPRPAVAQTGVKFIDLGEVLFVKPKEKQMPIGEFPKPEPEPVANIVANYQIVEQPKVSNYSGDVWATAMTMCDAKFGVGHREALTGLIDRESGWNYQACNSSSGAYGLFQSLPASKMASHGADYLTNPVTQIAWGLDYILERYGNPTNANAFQSSHNWY